jgi:hypothetical protein
MSSKEEPFSAQVFSDSLFIQEPHQLINHKLPYSSYSSRDCEE